MMKHLDRLEEYAAVALLAVMTVLVFAQVVLRFLFGLGFGWIDELARVAFVWVVYLGAVVGMRRALHLRVVIGLRALPQRGRVAAELAGDLVLLLFCAAMTWHGTELVLSTLEFSFKLPSTKISMFWPYLIMPASFALQALRLVLRRARGGSEVHHV